MRLPPNCLVLHSYFGYSLLLLLLGVHFIAQSAQLVQNSVTDSARFRDNIIACSHVLQVDCYGIAQDNVALLSEVSVPQLDIQMAERPPCPE